jgi:hypothetical protein
MATCLTKGCNKKAGLNRKICHSCRIVIRRNNDPIGYQYSVLKCNAKRRKKQFTLTKQEFIDFCERTNYMLHKGIFGDSLHIDRIRDEEGYHAANIQVLTNRDNLAKKVEYFRCKALGIPFIWQNNNSAPVYSIDINSNNYVPF